MNRTVTALAVATLLFGIIAVGGCSKTSAVRNVFGEVFVVTPAGESVKLALVEINLYNLNEAERAFTEWSESVKRECEPRLNELQRQAKAVLAETEARKNKADAEEQDAWERRLHDFSNSSNRQWRPRPPNRIKKLRPPRF